MRGRKPKPAALHALHGNPSRDGARHEPPAPGTVSEPPDWLTNDQRAVWLHCIEHAPRNVLKAIDGGLLAAYVVAVDLHKQATIQLREEGLIRADGRINPLNGIIVKQALVMLKAASELGFTPTSRARIGNAMPEEEGEPEPGSLRAWLKEGDEMRARHAAQREAERTAKKKPN